jgi:3-oxoacyl-[acyl-carrier protein] reductase
MSKRVLITGGNKGIGRCITQAFLEHGDSIVIVARDFKGFDLSGNPNITAISYDLSNPDGVPDLVKQIGDVDIIINNAGTASRYNDNDYPGEAVKYLVNLNLASPIAIISAYLTKWIEKGEGRAVNIASQAGVFGHSDTWYGATKAGLINATKSFAGKYGRHGLVFNAVSPGPVEGDLIRSAPNPERYERVINRTILKRTARPEEVAALVYWLAKDAPVYLNGENYMITNGTTSLEA